MRIFITGSTGYIGLAAAKAFRQKGHHVTGLARSREKAHQLAKEEIIPLLGDMDHPEEWIDSLENIDIYIHAGFDTSGEGVSIERKTLDAIFKQISPESIFVYTSGIWVYGNTQNLALETDVLNPAQISSWRPQHEQLVLNAPCRSLIIRPAVVYGKEGGLTQLWFKSAHAENILQVGEGYNHMPFIHVDDLAKAYVKVAFQGNNKEIYNVGDNSNYTVGEITSQLKSLSGASKVTALSLEKAREEYGALADALLLDQTVSSEKARSQLNWQPLHPPLLSDLKTYYEAWRTTSLEIVW